MSGPGAQDLTGGGSVAPNATVDVSVDLTAPNAAGTYIGYWRIREPGGTGEYFGLSTGAFFVEIQAVAVQPAPIPDWPVLRLGDSGDEVTALQHLLNFKGYGLVVNGQFGSLNTRIKVRAFQTDEGLTADGIVGPLTWAKLVEGAQIQSGSNNDAVEAASSLLKNKYGYIVGIHPAKFSSIKDTATKSFQADKGLAVDGIIGPNTWHALISY